MATRTQAKPVLSERVRKLRETLLETRPVLSTERLRFLEESYRETEGQPTIVRRARLFEKILGNMTIFIDENPVVGTQTQFAVGVNPLPEYSCDWMRTEADVSGYLGKVQLGDEEKKLLSEAARYWHDKCIEHEVYRKWAAAHPTISHGDLDDAGLWIELFHKPRGRINVDYGKVLDRGLNGIVAEIEEQLRRLPVGTLDALRKSDALEAMLVACKAVVAFAGRYAALAADMARREKDEGRRKELERIAETCRRVPANPARTFYEALQSLWFVHLVLQIDHVASGISLGRFCRYMHPFYKRDREVGRITDEEVVELLELLFIKLTAIGQYTSIHHFKESQGCLFQNLSLGGVTEGGEDASNELDLLVMEAQKRVRLPQPTLSVLWHDKLPSEFLMKAAELVGTGIGMPAFFNSGLITQRLLNQGATLADARNHCIIGCVEGGLSHNCRSLLGSGINMAKFLELALSDGRDALTGKQIGPQTGGAVSFRSYGELHEAIREQFRYFLPLKLEISQLGYSVKAERAPYAFASALVDDCIERATEVNAGGARYGMDGDGPVGITDLADSLAAIKKRVFEDKSVSMERLLEALRADFNGYDEVRRLLLDAPKYGNDDDYVDTLAREWYDIFWDEHQKFTDYLGCPQRAFALSAVWHSPFGAKTGALPSGRKAREPLADGAGSASPGKDRNGPTALVRSATRAVDCGKFASNLLNMKFHPSALASREGLARLLALIKSYMDLGGHHVQFNVVSTETLRDAQAHPEQYRDLIVRVAGFSAFFIHLEPRIQNEIIKRTELTLG